MAPKSMTGDVYAIKNSERFETKLLSRFLSVVNGDENGEGQTV